LAAEAAVALRQLTKGNILCGLRGI